MEKDTPITLQSHVRRQITARELLLRIAAVLGFAILMAISAQVHVPRYHVPVSLQTMAAVTCAMTLGPRLGAASMILYLTLGAVGLPFYSEARGGWTVLTGATGGYLLGFALCQPIVARIARSRRASWLGLNLASLAGCAIIFGLGVPWLKMTTDYTWAQAIWDGCLIFIPIEIIKMTAASVVGVWTVPWSMKRGW